MLCWDAPQDSRADLSSVSAARSDTVPLNRTPAARQLAVASAKDSVAPLRWRLDTQRRDKISSRTKVAVFSEEIVLT